jgi:hypothetical protein
MESCDHVNPHAPLRFEPFVVHPNLPSELQTLIDTYVRLGRSVVNNIAILKRTYRLYHGSFASVLITIQDWTHRLETTVFSSIEEVTEHVTALRLAIVFFYEHAIQMLAQASLSPPRSLLGILSNESIILMLLREETMDILFLKLSKVRMLLQTADRLIACLLPPHAITRPHAKRRSACRAYVHMLANQAMQIRSGILFGIVRNCILNDTGKVLLRQFAFDHTSTAEEMEQWMETFNADPNLGEKVRTALLLALQDNGDGVLNPRALNEALNYFLSPLPLTTLNEDALDEDNIPSVQTLSVMDSQDIESMYESIHGDPIDYDVTPPLVWVLTDVHIQLTSIPFHCLWKQTLGGSQLQRRLIARERTRRATASPVLTKDDFVFNQAMRLSLETTLTTRWSTFVDRSSEPNNTEITENERTVVPPTPADVLSAFFSTLGTEHGSC